MAGLLTLLVLLWIVLAACVAAIAEKKGYSGLVFLVLGFVATPLVSFLVIDRRPDKTPRPATAGTGGGRADDLAKLAALREQGALTDDEFAQEKARVLGEAAP